MRSAIEFYQEFERINPIKFTEGDLHVQFQRM